LVLLKPHQCGMEQLVARFFQVLCKKIKDKEKIVGSSPTPATKLLEFRLNKVL